jgi:hypothetical protein
MPKTPKVTPPRPATPSPKPKSPAPRTGPLRGYPSKPRGK